jgi:hypothetical protein
MQLRAYGRCAEAIDGDLARGLWPKTRATYRYFRIFFDWALGAVLSSCHGYTVLADGMHFAYDGMLAVGRMARAVGDDDTYNDVAYRTARHQVALYQAWSHAKWVQSIDYAIGHISNARVAASAVETRGAIDGYFEEVGANTLELGSFWETSNYFYFDTPVQQQLYRDFGIEQRARALEYDVMPAVHPSWFDGHAQDSVDQRFYGSNYTDAHLYARGDLFHDDPAKLFDLYQTSHGAPVADQWYQMYWHGWSGPTLLAIERAPAPVVVAPIADARVTSATYDVGKKKLVLTLLGDRTMTTKARVRAVGGTWKDVPAKVCRGGTTTVTVTSP